MINSKVVGMVHLQGESFAFLNPPILHLFSLDNKCMRHSGIDPLTVK